MPFSLSAVRSRSLRLLVVLLAGLLPAGLVSPSVRAETAVPAGRIGGVVSDELNRPLGGATVALTAGTDASARSVATDDRGRWSLALPQGQYDLSVRTADPAVAANVRGVTIDDDTRINVVVAGKPVPTVHFTGRILDGDGKPIGGASLAAGEATATTAADGRFALDTAAGRYPLSIGNLGGGDSAVTIDRFDLASDRNVTITLPLVAVDVVVRDEQSRPVGGAEIKIQQSNACSACPDGYDLSAADPAAYGYATATQTTGADGHARFVTLPADEAWITASAPGLFYHQETRAIAAGKTVQIALKTAPAPPPPPPPTTGTVTFSGRLLDAAGAPYTGGDVELLVHGSSWAYHSDFGPDGSFSFTTSAGVNELIVAVGTNDWECCDDRPETHYVRLTVPDFDLTHDRHQDLRLPAMHFPVTVVDPSGTPVPGAWVKAASDHPVVVRDVLFPGSSISVWTEVDRPTGADGIAILGFVAGAVPKTISVDPPGGYGLPAVATLDPTDTAAAVHLKDGPTLQGRLRDKDGQPLLVTHGWLVGEGRRIPFTLDPTTRSYAVTAPAGRYRITLDDHRRQEGESIDWNDWRVTTELIQLTGDRTLDLTVPLGKAVVRAVGPDGLPIDDFEDQADAVSIATTSVGSGIDATGSADIGGPGSIDVFAFTLIGPALATSPTWLWGSPALRVGVHVAPGEDTVIAFAPGSGPDAENAPPSGTTTDPGTPPRNDPPAGTATTPNPARTGYWALSSDGTVYNFGKAAPLGNATAGAVDLEPTPTGNGYWTLSQTGAVHAFGDATNLGDVDTTKLGKGEAPTSLSTTPAGNGYWVFTNKGRAIAFGDAAHLGDMSQVKLNGPVLGSVATPTGKGYYMVASDGGIFAFGDAAFAGSMGGKPLNKPVQSLVPDADGKGYWLVASDGGIFAFDAPFRGSMGASKLNKPMVGMVRYGDGYLMVGADGGIFNFSTAPFAGSLGDKPPASPVVAVAALP